jgi:hypothetical protein
VFPLNAKNKYKCKYFTPVYYLILHILIYFILEVNFYC